MSRVLRLALRLFNLGLPLTHLLYGLMVLAPTAVPVHRVAAQASAGVGREGAGAVVRVSLTVSDMARSIEFYTSVLQFRLVSDSEVTGADWERLSGVFGVRIRLVTLALGKEELRLMEFLAASVPGRPAPPDARSNDRWFQHVAIITSDMDSAYHRLRTRGVRHASTAPQLLPRTIPNAAGIRAFYFRDPDGHPLEILQFPPDKGAPRWQSQDQLFLGIDHTAIVVGSTERSLAFYRDLLGLRVAGGSENFGTEQAHLNNVEGAHLRITALRAPEGPGVELLQYLAPTDGRPYPADGRATDLIYWQTTVLVPDPERIRRRAARLGLRMVSRPPSPSLGNSAPDLGVVLRDPDGHAVQLVSP